MMIAFLKRYWFLFSLLTLLLSAGWIWFSIERPNNVNITAPAVGFNAPDFTLEDTSGNAVLLSTLRGQVVLINFWASWCAPCKAEMPGMQNVYEEYQDQGFTILAVNVTKQDQKSSVEAFISKLAISFPVLYDTEGRVADLYRNQALPTSFFIDSDGIIRDVVIGGPMAETLIRTRVEKYLIAKEETQ